MSRRCHHGSPRHVRASGRERRRPASATELDPRPGSPLREDLGPGSDAEPLASLGSQSFDLATADDVEAIGNSPAERADPPPPGDARAPVAAPMQAAFAPRPPHERPARGGPGFPLPTAVHEDQAERGATAPQFRRFIKSRAYVPMHELRRRFGINGGEDDVTPIELDRNRIFVGLPEREGRLLGELLRGGDIGYELSLDPITPIVVGVYPMRPVSRA